jgi:hypothetical protein
VRQQQQQQREGSSSSSSTAIRSSLGWVCCALPDMQRLHVQYCMQLQLTMEKQLKDLACIFSCSMPLQLARHVPAVQYITLTSYGASADGPCRQQSTAKGAAAAGAGALIPFAGPAGAGPAAAAAALGGVAAPSQQKAIMAVINEKGTSSAAVSRRLASKWPRPLWHAPWKCYRVISGHLG